jgi:hypothetical protein
MATVWIVALAVLACLAGCRAVERRPVEVDLPVAERHFIVRDGGGGGERGDEPRARAWAAGAGGGGMRRTN